MREKRIHRRICKTASRLLVVSADLTRHKFAKGNTVAQCVHQLTGQGQLGKITLRTFNCPSRIRQHLFQLRLRTGLGDSGFPLTPDFIIDTLDRGL